MRALVRALAAALMAGAATGASMAPAAAQSYDGGTVIKFGAFWQGTQTHFSQERNRVSEGSGTSEGWLNGGLSVGLDINLPYRWMIGVEMDGSFGDARGTVSRIDYGLDYLFNVRGRLGYYARPDLMIYGTTGVSYLGFEAQSLGVGRFKAAETVTGWNLGIGVEYAWHHVILFGEYSHSFFGGREFSIGDDRIQADADADVFRLGIKFKVGHDHAHGLGRMYDPPPLK